MNFDDFARHMTLKYRVALAIAVLKGKPENVSIDQHINHLKDKIVGTDMDSDSDMTVCSDDFLIDDDEINEESNERNEEVATEANLSANILEGFDFDEFIADGEHKSVTQVLDYFEVDAGLSNKEVGNDSQNISTQATLCDNACSQKLNEPESVKSTLTFCESTVKDKENLSNPNIITDKGNHISDHLSKNFNPIELKQGEGAKDTCDDSQKTQLYSLYGVIYDYTHVSESQSTFCEIDKKHLYKTPIDVSISEDHHGVTEKELTDKTTKHNPNVTQNNNKDFHLDNNNREFLSEPAKNQNISKLNTNEIGINDIQTQHKRTDAKVNFFETHNNTFGGIENFVQDMHKDDYSDKVKTQIYSSTTLPVNIFHYINETKTRNTETKHETNVNKNTVDTEVALFKTQGHTFDYTEKTDHTIKTFDKVNTNKINTKVGASDIFQNTYNDIDGTEANNSNTTNVLETVNNDNVNRSVPNENLIEIDLEDERLIEANSQAELIPFKVLEELNRIKSYLNKKDKISTDGCATDSGYKSDSQSRSSNKSLPNSSDRWVNQSAHCLLKFVLDCPIVLRTRDISNEISRTLGRLIDRLHDEEKYPTFLEEVLEAVEKLLKDVYEGDGYAEDVILRKDVYIQRLFHLNKSHHIIKYTLDKITQLLEGLLSRIAEDGALEITNTVEIENLCYIFYILEYILKRHAATKDLLSQAITQTSQDDERSLKKSSITDIWRRKWNPNYRSETSQVDANKKSAETKCSEILNKIIVKAMDGYSLVSFAALQCYNMLQS